jgi:signal transduction histidine kinase/ligand-binding sensor domain-containing protein
LHTLFIFLRHLRLHIILFFIACNVQGQQANLFENISTAHGLPSNYVFCSTEDAAGRLWAGTDKGLCCFTGTGWRVWDTDNGLPGNYVSSILSDKRKGLWLGLSEKGWSHFDITTGTIQLLAIPGIQHIVESYTDKEGNLLLAYKSNNIIKNVVAQPDGSLQQQPLQSTGEPAGSPYAYYNKVQDIYHVPVFSNQPFTNPQNIPAGKLILHQLNGIKAPTENEAFFCNDRFFVSNNCIAALNGTATHLIATKIFPPGNSLILHAQAGGKQFFTRLGGQLYAIDTASLSVTVYGTADGLGSTQINHLYAGKDGSLYVSTMGGGIFVLRPYAAGRYAAAQLPVYRMQYHGGSYYTLANGWLYQLTGKKIIAQTFLRNDILSFHWRNDTLVAGSFSGLHCYVLRGNKARLLRTLPLTAGISDIWPQGNGWLFSTYGGGFMHTRDFVTRKMYNHQRMPFSNIERSMPVTGGYAALSFESGFFICDTAAANMHSFNKANGLLSNYVITVHEYHDSLWVGSKEGVSIIKAGKVMQTLSAKDGFKGKKTMLIFHDEKGRLWVVSDKYLHLYQDGGLHALGSLHITSGAADVITAALYEPQQHTLFAATAKGLQLLDINGVQPDTSILYPVLSSINTDEQMIKPAASFTIPYQHQNVTFSFLPVSKGLTAAQIFYRLNNNNWLPVSDSLSVNFSRLRPGSYVLQAKTINADGYESPVLTLAAFTVKQPFYFSGWFIALCVLVLAALVWWLVQYLARRKYRLQQQLEVERQRISRDLHDNIGAYTSALIANVQQLKITTGETGVLLKMEQNAQSILQSLRETIWVLNNRETSVQAFSDGFKQYCIKLLRNYEHISFDVKETITQNRILPAATAIHLNKILQEAVQNCIKHSGATQISYAINCREQLHIQLSDDGTGFDPAATGTGSGLENMRWRAAEAGIQLTISSQLGGGTQISILLT